MKTPASNPWMNIRIRHPLKTTLNSAPLSFRIKIFFKLYHLKTCTWTNRRDFTYEWYWGIFSLILIMRRCCKKLLGVQLCFRRFSKIWGFILKQWLPIYDSKYSPSLATTFFIFLEIVGYHLEKTMRLLRRSTNQSIFWLLHKSGNTDEPGRMPSI